MTILKTLVVAALVLSFAPAAVSQDTQKSAATTQSSADKIKAAEALVAALPAKLDPVLKFGKTITRVLRRAGKNHEKVEPVLRELRQALRTSTVEVADAKDEEMEKVALDLAQALDGLVALGLDAAAVAVKAAAEAKDPMHKLVLAKVEDALYIAKARAEMAPFVGKGTYHGMFAHLAPLAPKIANAFYAVFASADTTENERAVSVDGVSETGSKANTELIENLKKLAVNPDQDAALRDFAFVILARLGERQEYDKRIKEVEKKLQAAAAKKPQEPIEIYSILHQLALMHQNIHDYKQTAVRYVQSVSILAGIPYEQMNDGIKRALSGDFYNMACVLARLGRMDDAFWSLDHHFNFGGDNYDWANQDGDLAALRGDKARFDALIGEWKGGKKKRLGVAMKLETFQTILTGVAPEMSRPSSQPTSAPASQPTKPADGGN